MAVLTANHFVSACAYSLQMCLLGISKSECSQLSDCEVEMQVLLSRVTLGEGGGNSRMSNGKRREWGSNRSPQEAAKEKQHKANEKSRGEGNASGTARESKGGGVGRRQPDSPSRGHRRTWGRPTRTRRHVPGQRKSTTGRALRCGPWDGCRQELLRPPERSFPRRPLHTTRSRLRKCAGCSGSGRAPVRLRGPSLGPQRGRPWARVGQHHRAVKGVLSCPLYG